MPDLEENPTTPIDTPHLSSETNSGSPDTPHLHLQTPAHRDRSGTGVMIFTAEEEESMGVLDVEGLGYGSDLDLASSRKSNLGNKGKARDATVHPKRNEEMEEGEDEREFPDAEELERLRGRLYDIKGKNRLSEDGTELLDMVERLLSPMTKQLPFLQGQLVAQRETIRTMQEQARLSAQLTKVERERHSAEKQSWHIETKALLNAREAEIAAGTRPRKVLDLDVGYHQELEAANKRLEMDNRLMAPRLADTQRQIDKLVTELRHLRSHVILSTSPLEAGQSESSRHRRRRSLSPVRSGQSSTTMGDARTEHLLLAARKVRSMRAQGNHVGRLTLEELKRGGVVGPDGGLGYSEGYGGLEEEESEDQLDASEDEEELFSSDRRASMKGNKPLLTPLLPRAKKSGKAKIPPTTPKGGKSNGLLPETTPGGNNFSDLLRAAELATRPATPSPEKRRIATIPGSAVSAARSTTRAREEDITEQGSPSKRVKRDWDGDHSSTQVKDASTAPNTQEDPSSALDLLAQASQLDVAQSQESEDSAPLPSPTRLGGLMKDNNDELENKSKEVQTLGPAIDLRNESTTDDIQIDPSLVDTPVIPSSTPKIRPRKMSTTSELATPRLGNNYYDYEEMGSPPNHKFALVDEIPLGAYASPTGGTVPGLGKYVHLTTSNMPARRIRSPYLKWTVEEDELLARAVAMHGEKWDLVSKGVPTRSYHQVRQRWLRKTGAFDKKPLHDSSLQDEDKETSPTPLSGKTPIAKKRKV